MPGYAFHLEVLKQVEPALRREDRVDAALLNSPFARLGAFGPDLLLYTPPIEALATDLADHDLLQQLLAKDPKSLGATDLQILEDLFQKPIGAGYSALFSTVVIPNWPELATIVSFVQQAATIAQTQNTGALGGFFSQIQGFFNALTKIATNLGSDLDTALSLATLIVGGPWMESAPSLAVLATLLPRADPKACRPYEFLRWHKSGQFAAALWRHAEDEQQKAFAMGWMSHLAASVTGEPFINNIVGGPYRTHWWRNRLAQNFVDAWTFGRFEPLPLPAAPDIPSMDGDTPTPAYQDWAPLYGANLQDKFDVSNLGGAPVTNGIPEAVTAMSQGLGSSSMTSLTTQFPFPANITAQLTAALADTYPAGSQPQPPAALTADAFAEAFVGAWSVFWFLTSGEGPLGNDIVGPPPTASCAANPPSWTKTSSNTPPPSSGSVVSHSGSGVCEAVLAILAVLAFLTGNIGAGIGLVIGALEESPSTNIDWGQVSCDIFWVQSFIEGLLAGVRDLLWILTFAYPPPIMLGRMDTNDNWVPATDWTDASVGGDVPAALPNNEPPTGGVPLTKTHTLRIRDEIAKYPRGLDTGPTPDGKAVIPDFDYFRFPVNAAEETDSSNYPATDPIPADIYADQVVSGLGLLNGGMVKPVAAFPTNNAPFGDAVSNAVQVIVALTTGQSGLPDYNLDGDRGYGWTGWRPKPLTNPATPPVQVESD